MNAIGYVSLCGCTVPYLRNHIAELHQFLCMLPIVVDGSYFGSAVIRLYFRFCG